MKKRQLKNQLQDSGAKEQDIADMSTIAEHVSTFNVPGLSEKTKQRIAQIPDIHEAEPAPKRPLLWIGSGFATVAAVFGFVFIGQSIYHQATLPTQTTEQVRTAEPSPEEIQLEQTKMKLEELQQAEEVSPKEIEEAEKEYEQAYDRWENWKQDRDSRDSDDDNEWDRNIDRRNRDDNDDDRRSGWRNWWRR